MNDIQATYEVHEPDDGKPTSKAGAAQLALTMAGIIAALAISALAFVHSSNTGEAAQIRALAASNTRLAGELATQNTEIARLRSQLAGMSARVTAASPANDTSLITCGDLRSMRLYETTGASIQAGGSIGLSQDPVPLPAHCPRR